MEAIVKDFLGQVNHLSPWIVYTTFFISAILQLTFPPYPGDTVLIAGGYLGSMGLSGGEVPIFVSYWLGTLFSSFLLYSIGEWKGEEVLKSKLVRRYFPEKNQEKARKWVFKYGIIAFILCKFIPGLNSLIIVFGGIFKFNRILFYLGAGVASTIHNVAFFTVGRAIGDNYNNTVKFLLDYNRVAFALVGIATILYITYQIFKIQSRRV